MRCHDARGRVDAAEPPRGRRETLARPAAAVGMDAAVEVVMAVDARRGAEAGENPRRAIAREAGKRLVAAGEVIAIVRRSGAAARDGDGEDENRNGNSEHPKDGKAATAAKTHFGQFQAAWSHTHSFPSKPGHVAPCSTQSAHTVPSNGGGTGH